MIHELHTLKIRVSKSKLVVSQMGALVDWSCHDHWVHSMRGT
jgi:hypothetical protein